MIKGASSRLSYLKHVHQANLMAFTKEQHTFVSVIEIDCILEKGHSSASDDYTLVYYPAASFEDNTAGIKVKRVEYPSMGSFGETVHWLDTAYAEDKSEWNKHANICLSAHQMNLLVLILNTKSIVKTQKYSSTITTFQKAVSEVISQFNLNIIPVIYLTKKIGGFGDETERLETKLGLDFQVIELPQIRLIHGMTKNQILFPHLITDLDSFTPSLLGYWVIYTMMDEDLKKIEEKFEELRQTVLINE